MEQKPRRAAVIVPIVAHHRPTVLFVRRAAHVRRNAGQMAFPGGLEDERDRGDLRTTALREFEEELGVSRHAVEIVHRLPDALVINRTVLVSPFVGILASLPSLFLDETELDAAVEIPLSRIATPGALHEGIETFGGFRISTWQFDDGATHVWGATARILRALLDALRDDERFRAALAERGILSVT